MNAKKEIKKVLDLSKLTLFGIWDRTQKYHKIPTQIYHTNSVDTTNKFQRFIASNIAYNVT